MIQNGFGQKFNNTSEMITKKNRIICRWYTDLSVPNWECEGPIEADKIS